MKSLILGLIMVGFICMSYGQYGGIIGYKKAAWNDLKQSKLYVVYEEEGNSEYDKTLKEAVKSNWTFSEVEYISYNKFEEIQKDESNFFLLSVGLTSSKVGRYSQSYSYMYLIRGFKRGSKNGDISQFPQLASLQTGDDAREVYMPLFIKNLNRSIEKVLAGELKSIGDGVKAIKANTGEIKNKPLYVLNLDLNDKVTSEADIKKDYEGEVFVVSKEELAGKIAAGEDVNVFMTGRSSTKSWAHVYNVKTGEEMYVAFNLINKKFPAGIIPYHSKKWNK